MQNHVGQQLGNFRLIRLVDTGGFSDIYLAEHLHFGTQVAVKVLHQPQQKSDAVRKLQNEGRILAHLKHSNIAQVLEFGTIETNGMPFLIMNYHPDKALHRQFPRGRSLPLDTVLHLVKQIASALQFIHEKGLIYRGVKPENMALGDHNEVLLCDFNAIIQVPLMNEQSIELIGTPSYMAPEQFHANVYQSSDQYALGILVYEWLSGERPFKGFSFTDLKSQHLYSIPPSLSNRVSSISPAIEQVVLRALAKDPQERYPHIQDFAVAFEQACLSEQQSTRVVELQAPPLPQFSPSSTSRKQINVFFSYSHKDELLRDQLETHLSTLKRQKLITNWHDRRIEAGDDCNEKINSHLNTADIILLLISADFIASDYCYSTEMERALARHTAGDARVIPVILRPTDWSNALFGQLKALPKDAKPITTWHNTDEAFLDVVKGIRAMVEELTK